MVWFAVMATVALIPALARAQTPPAPPPQAATPISPPAAPPAATPVSPPAALSLAFDDVDTFTWAGVPGAIGYTLRGDVFVVRTNAARPICNPPLEADNRNVNVTASFGETARSFLLTLPSLPPQDRWFVASFSVQLTAYDAAGRVITGEMIGHIAETTCALPAVPTPLPEPVLVGQCEIPAGYREVTTPAANEHGQRVFESPDFATRIYVRADGSCVGLVGGAPPVPEFVPDGPLGTPGIPDTVPLRGLPGTGGGAAAGRGGLPSVSIEVIAGSAIALLLGGAWLRRRSPS
ncbi:MAG TPA: hypothetical protein VEZ14_11795 [Dehalococcoidia bacterium]|nr:hypothetical protein [Dehalococcoidia bacterium]